MKSIEQLKYSPEYSELTRARAEDFLGGLIRDIKHDKNRDRNFCDTLFLSIKSDRINFLK